MSTYGICRFTGRLIVILGISCVVAGALGCAVLDERTQQELEAAYGPHPPQWEATYAAEWAEPGAVWRMYLKGTDPDGDMQFIHLWMDVSNRAFTPIRLTIDPDQRHNLSGYLILQTWEFGPDHSLFVIEPVRFLVTLEDRAGHRSETVEIYLRFQMGVKQPKPPAGVFADRLLGRIPVTLFPRDTIGNGNDSGAEYP
jgi:hypothetical protein